MRLEDVLGGHNTRLARQTLRITESNLSIVGSVVILNKENSSNMLKLWRLDLQSYSEVEGKVDWI